VPSGISLGECPAARLRSPLPSSILNEAVTPIPYDFNAWKKLTAPVARGAIQRGVALKSVCQTPSAPPASAVGLGCAVKFVADDGRW